MERGLLEWVGLLALVLGLPGCLPAGGGGGGGGSSPEGGSEGGREIASAFFGGGDSTRAPEDDVSREGRGGAEAGGGVDVVHDASASCEAVCGGLVVCLDEVCGLELDMRERRDAVFACEQDCEVESTAQERAQAAALVEDDCAGVREIEAGEGVCGGLDAEDFTEPRAEAGEGEGRSGARRTSPGVSGPPSNAECEAFCEVAIRCCAEDEDCEVMDVESCPAACREELPVEVVTCVLEHPELSCDGLVQACLDTGSPTPPPTEERSRDAGVPSE